MCTCAPWARDSSGIARRRVFFPSCAYTAQRWGLCLSGNKVFYNAERSSVFCTKQTFPREMERLLPVELHPTRGTRLKSRIFFHIAVTRFPSATLERPLFPPASFPVPFHRTLRPTTLTTKQRACCLLRRRHTYGLGSLGKATTFLKETSYFLVNHIYGRVISTPCGGTACIVREAGLQLASRQERRDRKTLLERRLSLSLWGTTLTSIHCAALCTARRNRLPRNFHFFYRVFQRTETMILYQGEGPSRTWLQQPKRRLAAPIATLGPI